jgi:hypothetical protein
MVVVAPEMPSTVFIDETYLQRILMNLLSNSFKFTVSGYVILLLHLKDGVLNMTVQDSGSGIPKSFLPQLFEPYKQVQARGAERGTGLGLSITKRLIERMHGSIVVKSRHQQDQGSGTSKNGSVFTLTIPIGTLEPSLEPPQPMRIAIMHDGRHRDIEGLTTAWRAFGAEVLPTRVTTDLSHDPETIIWADLSVLRKHHEFSLKILKQQQHFVLVPYKDKTLLDHVLGPTPLSNIVPIRKPLIWHHIVQTIIDTLSAPRTPNLNTNIKIGQNMDAVHNSANGSKKQETVTESKTVLLVEDNKVYHKYSC